MGTVTEEESAEQQQHNSQVIIEMLRGDEVNDRIAAAYKLKDVAAVIGGERTRKELLPFLSESVDDEDEVLVVLAESLGDLVPFVGGEEYVHVLLPLLEMLLTAEEGTVRQKAVQSTHTVMDSLSYNDFNLKYVSMVKRLATKEWFTARMSSCYLLAPNFDRLMDDRREAHVKLFASLCRDEVPMVRRVAAQNFGNFVHEVVSSCGISTIHKNGLVSKYILPLYSTLASNDQDSVRLHTPTNCISFGSEFVPLLSNANNEEKKIIEDAINTHILPLLISVSNDSEWRVRWTAASKFAEAVKAFSTFNGAVESLIPAYEKLLKDSDSEVSFNFECILFEQ